MVPGAGDREKSLPSQPEGAEGRNELVEPGRSFSLRIAAIAKAKAGQEGSKHPPSLPSWPPIGWCLPHTKPIQGEGAKGAVQPVEVGFLRQRAGQGRAQRTRDREENNKNRCVTTGCSNMST